RHTHPHPFGGEARDQLVGDRGCERFEQVVVSRVRDLLDRLRDRTVVDGLVEAVGGAAAADIELDVEDEALSMFLLVCVHAVVCVDAQAVQRDRDHATACATASASTCGFTSCTRRIVAPRSYAATAAATLAASRSPPLVSERSELLRLKPMSIGRPSAV